MRRKILLMIVCAMSFMLGACSSSKTPLVQPARPQPKPNEIKINHTHLANINVQLGVAYLEKNNYLMAKQKFMKALHEDPLFPASWYMMAYFYEITGNNKLAQSYYLKAIQLAPNTGETHNNYGTFLCRRHRYLAGINEFLTATKDQNYADVPTAFQNAGFCALLIPNYRLARNYFAQGLQNDPMNPDILLELAKIDYHLKDYKQARFELYSYYRVAKPTRETKLLAKKLKMKF